jgi:hypothetical protein
MKIVGKIVLGILAFIALIALAFVIELGGLKWKRFFAPKHEAVRREVFKETRSYNEGKLQDLTRYRLEYMRATTEDEKSALAFTIRHQFAEYDESKLPLELAEFVRKIKYGG